MNEEQIYQAFQNGTLTPERATQMLMALQTQNSMYSNVSGNSASPTLSSLSNLSTPQSQFASRQEYLDYQASIGADLEQANADWDSYLQSQGLGANSDPRASVSSQQIFADVNPLNTDFGIGLGQSIPTINQNQQPLLYNTGVQQTNPSTAIPTITEEPSSTGWANSTDGKTKEEFLLESQARGVTYEDALRNYNDLYGSNESMTGTQTAMQQAGNVLNNLPFINPLGTNLETELYMLGSAIGSPQGTKGRGLGILSSAGSALFGGGRVLLSGLAREQQNKTAEEYRQEQLRRERFTPNPQYTNQNNQGGITTFKYGGLFKFEDGGEMIAEATPQQEQSVPQENPMQQLMQGVAQALQQGVSPQQIMSGLLEQGLSEQQAQQLIQSVMQQIQMQQNG